MSQGHEPRRLFFVRGPDAEIIVTDVKKPTLGRGQGRGAQCAKHRQYAGIHRLEMGSRDQEYRRREKMLAYVTLIECDESSLMWHNHLCFPPWCNGSTRVFGTFSPGSSPGGGALRFRTREVHVSSSSVVVLAAGKGTRMKSKTPKVLHLLCGRTLLGHALHAAKGIDPEHIVAVVRHERDAVAAEAQRVIPDVIIADQDDIPGTGRAVQCALISAKENGVDLGDTVLVTSGDVPLLESATLQKVLEAHVDASAAVTAVTTIAPDPTGYGRIVRDGEAIARIVEQRDASTEERAINEINAGIYAFDREFLEEALRGLGTDNDQGEVYLTDIVEIAATAGRLAQPYVLEDTWQAEGCNDLVQLATLRRVLNTRLCEQHMRQGVSIVDPVTTSLDVDVVLEADSRIEPFTTVRGHSIVRSGATVGPYVVIEDLEVTPGSTMDAG